MIFHYICVLSDVLDITDSALESSGYAGSCAVSCMHGCAYKHVCVTTCLVASPKVPSLTPWQDAMSFTSAKKNIKIYTSNLAEATLTCRRRHMDNGRISSQL